LGFAKGVRRHLQTGNLWKEGGWWGELIIAFEASGYLRKTRTRALLLVRTDPIQSHSIGPPPTMEMPCLPCSPDAEETELHGISNVGGGLALSSCCFMLHCPGPVLCINIGLFDVSAEISEFRWAVRSAESD
jgi:hypothetical protein